MELNNQENLSARAQVGEHTGKKVRTTIYLPVELHKAAKIYCAKNEISLTQFIINYLDKTVYTANS